MDDTLRKRALSLLKPPFRSEHGYIFDSAHNMVADNATQGTDATLRVRGWGRLQCLEEPEALQDAIGELISEALTMYWKAQPVPFEELDTTALEHNRYYMAFGETAGGGEEPAACVSYWDVNDRMFWRQDGEPLSKKGLVVVPLPLPLPLPESFQ